jgi:acyl carrier protein
MKTENILIEIANLMEMDVKDLNLEHKLECFVNWDSLTAISTIALIDAHFGLLLEAKEIEKCKTLNEIFKLVEHKKAIVA